ncbi:MAG: metallophosphoesterase family protein [Planctomycetota bacterium]|jgi:predicted phosphodiesterase
MPDDADFRLLVIADIHYGPKLPAEVAPALKHRPELGLELLRAAFADAAMRGGFDCVALMGDLVDDGQREDTNARLGEIRDAVAAEAPASPVLVVPGNHDCPADRLFSIFHTCGGLHEVGGCRFVVIVDDSSEGGAMVRPEDQRRLLREVARRKGGRIIVLHHNPINLLGEWAKVFMVANHEEVMRDYAACGVWLCVGAHCHAGQDLNEADGVLYFTAPCLCAAPFRYALITLGAGRVSVDTHTLDVPMSTPDAERS